MATKVNAFDVLKEMGNRNMSTLKGFGLSNVRQASSSKGNGTITMSVDPETATTVMLQKPIVFMLVVANKEDFDKVKAELESE